MTNAWVRGLIQQSLAASEASRRAFDHFLSTSVDPTIIAHVNSFAQDPPARETLFSTLGHPYTSRHFPHLPHAPHLLYPPYMLPDLKQTLREDLQSNLLMLLLHQAQAHTWEQSSEFHDFQRAFQALAEEHISREIKRSGASRGDALGELLVQTFQGHAFSLPLVDVVDANSVFRRYEVGEDDILQFDADTSGIALPQKQWDAHRNADLQRLVVACKGKTPPASIRKFCYRRCFYQPEQVQLAREELLKNVEARGARLEGSQREGMRLQEEKDGSVSKIFHLLQRLVNESFRTDFAAVDTPRRREVMLRVLNQYYVAYGKHFAWNFNLLLLLLLEFEHASLPDCVFVSMLKQTSLFFAAHEHSLDIANSAIRILSKADEQLVAGIRQGLEQCNARHSRTVNGLTELFVGWIEKLFVGVLRLRTVHFLWSQCTLNSLETPTDQEISQKVTKEVLCCACITVVRLLAEAIQEALRSNELERIFTRNVAKIRTLAFTDMYNTIQAEPSTTAFETTLE